MQGTTMPSRAEGLNVAVLDNETLVLETRSKVIHCLNDIAGFVFKHCDGKTPVGKVAELIECELGRTGGEQVVWSALASLGEKGLLDPGWRSPSTTRREFLQKSAIAASVPILIYSMTAPSPAQSASDASAASDRGKARGRGRRKGKP